MMKKNLLILAVAAAALASCSSDEVVSQNTTLTGNDIQQKEIGFVPIARSLTRSPQTGASFNTSDNFNVVAYLADGGTSAGDYFSNTIYRYQYIGGAASGSGSTWGGDPARYWPLSPSHINFLAVSNTSGTVSGKVTSHFGTGATTSAEGSGAYASRAVVTLSSNQAFNQADLMYAAGQGKVTQDGNALVYNNLLLEFQHALAWVNFKVKTSSTGASIVVNSIKLNGAHYNGTYTITNDGNSTGYDGSTFTNSYTSTSDLTATSNWTNLKGVWSSGSYENNQQLVPNTTYSAAADASSALTATAADFGGGLLVIPDGSATGFTMNYTITQGAVATTYDYTYTFAPTEVNWSERKKYTFIIDITLHEILVAPTVTDWASDDPYLVAIPQFAYSEGNVAGTYSVDNTECTYTATISGCAASTAYTLSESADWISEVPASVTSESDGKLTFKFKVAANASTERSADITFTNSTNNTKVTIKQAAGS